MRTRLTAIVLSIFFTAFVAVATAGSAWASSGSVPAESPAAAGGYPSAASVTADSDSGPAINGTLRYETTTTGENGQPTTERNPVPGVTITVKTEAGDEVGHATSDEDGKWTVAVPKAGTYQVTLDTSTLPDTVQLKDADKDTLPSVRVQSVLPGIAVFQLVEAGSSAASGGALEYYLSLGVDGLRFGLIIAMAAVGLSLVFGTTGLINFAHGELVTIGAVVAYVLGTSPLQWSLIIAIIVAMIAIGILGGLIERIIWRPLRARGTGLIQMFIISIGLSLLLRHTVLLFFGGQREQYAQRTVGGEKWHLGPVDLAPRDLVIIIVSIVVLLGVAVMLQRTRMGKAMRALSDNRDLAEASGIDVKKVILQVWILGGALAALGGVFFGLTTAVYWNMGYYLLLLMFAGVILGGLGSAYGAMLGSIVIGLVAQYSVAWSPSALQNAWALLLLIVVLLVRPQGILGRLQRAG